MTQQDANPQESHTITDLLNEWRHGAPDAGNRLMELVYAELHQIAAREMRRENAGHTLQTTALVHEAYVRIHKGHPVDWRDRDHFYALAARQMRRVLVDHARRQRSEKRGGGVPILSILDSDASSINIDDRLLAVDQALANLETLDPRAAKVVELRFFGGLSESDAARALDISVATLKRDWDFAKSWLTNQLSPAKPAN